MVVLRWQRVSLGRDNFMTAAVTPIDAGIKGSRPWGVERIETSMGRIFKDI